MQYKGQNKITYQNDLVTKFLIESLKYDNFEILIDTEDWNKVKIKRWRIVFSKDRNPYAMDGTKDSSLKLHKFIMDCPDKLLVDHKDHNTLDNRKQNLRICTISQNNMNRRKIKQATSKYKGIYLDRISLRWKAHIKFNKIDYHLGYFNNETEAALKYNEAARKYFGEFACLNEVKNG